MSEDPIDSRQMQIFVALAQGGSLKAAAERLKLTESAISHAVRNLEKNLDTKLFKRAGKGMELLEAGILFQAESVKILALMQDLRTRISEDSKKSTQEVRMACAPAFIQFALPDILKEYRRCFPNVEVKVTPADRDACLSQLESGEATAAIVVNLPTDQDKYEGSLLFEDELQVLMSAEHELASEPKVPIHKLSKETVYLQNNNSFTARMITSEIQRWSFHPKNLSYVANPEALRELIKMKLGISLQPLWAFRNGSDRDQFAWRPTRGLDLRRKWYFAWPKNVQQDLHLRSLMWLCEQAAKGLDERSTYEKKLA